ncbi:MAG: hypothetical protein CM1200mP10_18600 [Candidatus Neomarinimicrobiota bacterium]|nr:MAG: hypothetical protein CM1200mP10_18600 [Candidatus Neomarinimicrobiota bacterium]
MWVNILPRENLGKPKKNYTLKIFASDTLKIWENVARLIITVNIKTTDF